MVMRIINSLLWRTGISRMVPPLFWKPVSEGGPVKKVSQQTRYPRFPVQFDDDEINASFTEQNAKFAKVTDYLLEVEGPVLIEPKLGIAILGSGKFLEQSRNHTYTYPGTLQYAGYKMGLMPVIEMDEAIHFDGYVSENYYNFYADILCAFCWAAEHTPLSFNKPILVGAKVYNTRYFQWLLKNNKWFGALRWYVIDGTSYIKVKKLYKPWIFLQEAETWKLASGLFAPPLVEQPEKKIFLYRAAKYGRGVSNMEQVKILLSTYGFELVDTGTMSMEEQMELFANTKYLVAVHGAGITNIIFSNPEKLSLLEILPGRQKLNTHFYWLAETLGIKYDAILTEDMNAAMKFRLDPAVLERHIKKMLAWKREPAMSEV